MTEQKKYNTDGKTSEDRALDLFADMMIERIKSLSSKDGWKKPGSPRLAFMAKEPFWT
jgi:hypothetical protein